MMKLLRVFPVWVRGQNARGEFQEHQKEYFVLSIIKLMNLFCSWTFLMLMDFMNTRLLNKNLQLVFKTYICFNFQMYKSNIKFELALSQAFFTYDQEVLRLLGSVIHLFTRLDHMITVRVSTKWFATGVEPRSPVSRGSQFFS